MSFRIRRPTQAISEDTTAALAPAAVVRAAVGSASATVVLALVAVADAAVVSEQRTGPMVRGRRPRKDHPVLNYARTDSYFLKRWPNSSFGIGVRKYEEYLWED